MSDDCPTFPGPPPLPEKYLFRPGQKIRLSVRTPPVRLSLSYTFRERPMSRAILLGTGKVHVVHVVAVDKSAEGPLLEPLDAAFRDAAARAGAALRRLHGGPVPGHYQVSVSLVSRSLEGIGPGLYWWVRSTDESGMTGTGHVAQVAVFEDGSAALRWIKSRNAAGVQSTVIYESLEDLVHVHGHGEKKTGHLERIW